MDFRMPILNSIQTEKCKSIMFFHVQTIAWVSACLYQTYMPGTCLSYVSLRMLYLRHENQIIVCLILIHQSQSRINIEINNQPHFCVDLCSFCPAAWLSFDFFQSSGERVKTKLEVKPTTLLPILRRVSILSPL